MDERTAWSAIGGVLLTASAPNMAAWLVAATTKGSALPIWPAYIFGGLSLCGLYILIAAMARWWPFSYLKRSPAQVMDDCIRAGDELRDKLLSAYPGNETAMQELSDFTLDYGRHLRQVYPSIARNFVTASGTIMPSISQDGFIASLDTKLEVIIGARKGL